MSMNFAYDVFLSYSSKDKETVQDLARRLRQDGLRVWLDTWEIKPGDPIGLTIQHGLEKSRTVVLCMSPACFESEWSKLEHHTLLFRDPTNVQRRFIPLLIADCKPPDMLAQFAYIDWRQRSGEEYLKLLKACSSLEPPSKSEGEHKESYPHDITMKEEESHISSMTDLWDTKIERRSFIKLNTILGGAGLIGIGSIITGYLQAVGADLWKSTYGILDRWEPIRSQDLSNIKNVEMLLGDKPALTTILPPGTNKHLLRKDVKTPSLYLRTAFDTSQALHRAILNKKGYTVVPPEKAPPVESFKNLLVLGGPVATEQTRSLCDYKDQENEEDPRKPIALPEFRLPLRYYFHVGSRTGYGFWGKEKREVRRWHEDGTEGEFPLYGIFDRETGRYFAPPLERDRLAGDMLMIMRVPNPQNFKGTITVIGGLHGYCLKQFFDDLKNSLEMFLGVMNPEGWEYFQALVPYRIDSNRQITMDLKGQGDWRPYIESIDPLQYLNHFLPPPKGVTC